MHLSFEVSIWILQMPLDRRTGAPRFTYEIPLAAKAVSVDGTWCRDCSLLDISDSGARVVMPTAPGGLTEFFLLLCPYGSPVSRRCKVAWINGSTMGVAFVKTQVAEKLPKGVGGKSAILADLPPMKNR
jgi:PilZ domain-containing protein